VRYGSHTPKWLWLADIYRIRKPVIIIQLVRAGGAFGYDNAGPFAEPCDSLLVRS
jgi:hypothetical protein